MDKNIENKKTHVLSEEEMIKIESEIKDLKDLYDNEVLHNKTLTKENNELKADLLIKTDLLKESNSSVDLVRQEFIDDFNSFEKKIAVLEAINKEMYIRINNLNDIIKNLIR